MSLTPSSIDTVVDPDGSHLIRLAYSPLSSHDSDPRHVTASPGVEPFALAMPSNAQAVVTTEKVILATKAREEAFMLAKGLAPLAEATRTRSTVDCPYQTVTGSPPRGDGTDHRNDSAYDD